MISGVGNDTSCRQMFKDYDILSVIILLVIHFIKQLSNLDIHDFNKQKQTLLPLVCKGTIPTE
jgi:hypothetical protein